MLTEETSRDLRALVDADETQSEPRRSPWMVARRLIGALTVVASLCAVAWLLVDEREGGTPQALQSPTAEVLSTVTQLSEVMDEDDLSSAASDSTAPTTAAPPSATRPDDGEQFRELRYLPAGLPEGFELQSLVRQPDTAVERAYVRLSDDGEAIAVVLIDSVPVPTLVGAGVPEPISTSIHGRRAQLLPSGTLLQNSVAWDDPELGPMRASGTGLSAGNLVSFVNDLDLHLGDPNATDAGADQLPSDWAVVEGFLPVPAGPVWRANYVSERGEVIVVAAHSTPELDGISIIDTDTCATSAVEGFPAAACAYVLAWNDDDNVEVSIIGSSDKTMEFAEILRPASPNDVRVREGEIEPLTQLPLAAANPLIYLPERDSEWVISDALAHSSGSPRSTPALTLIERAAPETGSISGVVVANVIPGAAAPPPEAAGEPTAGQASENGSHYLEFVGSPNYESLDLAILAHLSGVSVGQNGEVQIAGRGAFEEFTRREFEIAYYNPRPGTENGGPVLGIVYENPAGRSIEQSVFAVPGFSPEAMATAPHDNQLITVNLRGTVASLIIDGDTTTLTWEESPGVLISLSEQATNSQGRDSSLALVELADELRRFDANDERLAFWR